MLSASSYLYLKLEDSREPQLKTRCFIKHDHFCKKELMKADVLIDDLKDRTLVNIEEAKAYNELPIRRLLRRENTHSWNVLECIEHLNRYGHFYISEIEKQIQSNSHRPAVPNFNSGFIGNHFAKSMLPRARKMGTFPDKNPLNDDLTKRTIDEFIQQQEIMMGLLERAKKININKVKTSISISKWFRLKLGDTFRVVVFHNQRHLDQAKRVLKNTSTNTKKK